MRARWLRRLVAHTATVGVVGSLAVTGLVGGGATPASAALPSGISVLANLGTGDSGYAEYVVTLGDKAFTNASDGTHTGSLFVSDGSGNNSLVKDIYPDNDDGVSALISNGSKVLFAANDGTHGSELWITDGTEANTKLLKDIIVGADSSYPSTPFLVGSTVYFFVWNSGAYDLWKTDGTTAGTVLVKASTTTDVYWGLGVSGKGYWVGSNPSYGRELWVTDGTEAGTQLVKDIVPGSTGAYPHNATAFGTKIAFIAQESSTYGLWVSDGTDAGTTRLYSSGSEWLVMEGLTNANGTLFAGTMNYGGCSTNNGVLVKSDGTLVGTSAVVTVPCADSSTTGGFAYFASAGSTAVFSHYTSAAGWELWKSDGTSGGTSLVKDIWPGTSGSSPDYWVKFGNKVFFAASTPDQPGDDYPLWVTDGTTAGTILVSPYGFYNNDVAHFAVGNTQAFFASNDQSHGRELWVTKGTVASTKIAYEINTKGGSDPSSFTPIGSKMLFSAQSSDYGTELFITDGTPANTKLVKDIRAGSAGSQIGTLAAIGSKAYFAADDGTNGFELWVSDGTSAGTKLVKDVRSGGNGSWPTALTVVGSTLFFTANDGTNGTELWKSDGTSAGTVLVKDINPGSNSSSSSYLTAVGSTLFFTAYDGTNGTELWKSDGTSAGTVLVKDIRSGSNTSFPSNLVAVGSTVFFQAHDGTNGNELWKSDGTDAGTVLVKDINAGSGGSSPSYLTSVGSTLFFGADDGTHGTELWKSDGTEVGTVLVKDIYSGSDPSYPYSFSAVGSALYFVGLDPTNGYELWKSDGTEVGTVLVKDLYPGSNSSYPYSITSVDGKAYFTADDGTHGYEAWKTDGTALGTTLAFDLAPGADSGGPSDFTQLGTNLLFYGETSDYGTELYAKSNKPEPVVSFTPPEKLNANTTYKFTATSTNPAGISIKGSDKCDEQPGAKLRTKGVGTCVITVSQAENGTYAAVELTFEVEVVAPSVTVTFNGFVYPLKSPTLATASARDIQPNVVTNYVSLQAKTTPKQAGCIVTFTVRPDGGGDPIATLEATSDDDGLATTDGINLPYATYDIELSLSGDCTGSASPQAGVVFSGVELPATGTNSTLLVWMALSLLTVGGALHFGRRTVRVARVRGTR